MIEFKNLSVGYDKTPLQKPFSLQVEQGEILSLIGPNGSGKSTFLKTLIKELPPVEGSVFIDGKNLRTASLRTLSRQVSALLTVPIKPELMTCRDVVAFGRYPFTGHFAVLKTSDEKKIDDAISLVQAQDYAQKSFVKVSDGQKQRIMLARAICQNPRLLVLDEPTNYLDIKWRLELLKILRDLSKTGVTIIASMHEIDLALKVSDRILCVGPDEVKELSDDETECKKQIRVLYNLPENFYTEEAFYSDLVKKYCSRRKKNTDRPDTDKTCESSFERLSLNIVPEPVAHSLQYHSPHLSQKNNAYPLMVQGTMSSAGKSFLVAGLCRIFRQDGFSVAPFKSQNMALNSFVTNEGLEMGRAQVMQAEAAGVEPSFLMNPILLKPNSDTGSQVIVNGEVLGDMGAKEYFAYKKNLVPHIMKAYNQLSGEHQIIVIEGAGSPAEINLKENDIVNMGMAEMADSPVILIADIDRGGVFAQILGTIELLTCEERKRIKGFIINKFRGDKSILDTGIQMIEVKTGIPCLGTLPYMKIQLDDEDSLSTNLHTFTQFRDKKDEIQLAVVRLPHISNFTDFIPLQNLPEVNLYYVSQPKDLGSPDCIIIPGTKNTTGDLEWLKKSGLAELVKTEAKKGTPITGICGGFQMLGEKLFDGHFEKENEQLLFGESPAEADKTRNPEVFSGLSLLPVSTVFSSQKTRTRVSGKILDGKTESRKSNGEKSDFEESSAVRNENSSVHNTFQNLAGLSVSGYEIHMGQTEFVDDAKKCYFSQITDSVSGGTKLDGAVKDNVFGTYIHGLFDEKEFCRKFVEILARRKGIDSEKWSQNVNANEKSSTGMKDLSKPTYSDRPESSFTGNNPSEAAGSAIKENAASGQDSSSIHNFKETQYNLLAETLRKHLDMKKIYEIIGLEKPF